MIFQHIIALVLASVSSVLALQTLPPVQWTLSPGGHAFIFNSRDLRTIYISPEAANTRDDDGLTLIPPSGLEFAKTFADDLGELFGGHFSVKTIKEKPKAGIYFSILEHESAIFSRYESGEHTSEGYELTVGENLIEISGAGARGMFWGSRTFLQELRLSRSHGKSISLPVGHTQDAPAFPTRGYLLDAGRKWYAPSFLKDLCTYASFFKLSEFHYHISDNYPLNRGQNGTWNKIYSQFSLYPEDPVLQGLITRKNETLSRADFSDLQSHCASRGVTVIPEIEAPGHALAITKWKPQLALEKKDLLNLTHPETIPTVKAIWDEFLPWFKVKEVHIGADEYDATLEDDYVAFVNEMNRHVRRSANKSVRIWGTHGDAMFAVDKDITIQHWQYGESDPAALVKSGYNVINSEDWWGYTSLKSDHSPILPATYPQFFNTTRTLNFANIPGWQWTPRLINPFNTTAEYQLPCNSTKNKGAIIASWSDSGPDATTQLEAFYAIRNGLPIVGSRMWSGERGPRLDSATLEQSSSTLTQAAPGQNLDRKLTSPLGGKNKLLLEWTPKHRRGKQATKLGLGSKGMNYTLWISYAGEFSLESPDAKLTLTSEGELLFDTDGFVYPLRSVDEDAGFDAGHPGRIWANETRSSHEVVKLDLTGEVRLETDVLGGTRVWDKRGTFKGRFEVYVYGGRNTVFSWNQMAFVAPLEYVRGAVRKIRLWDQ